MSTEDTIPQEIKEKWGLEPIPGKNVYWLYYKFKDVNLGNYHVFHKNKQDQFIEMHYAEVFGEEKRLNHEQISFDEILNGEFDKHQWAMALRK